MRTSVHMLFALMRCKSSLLLLKSELEEEQNFIKNLLETQTCGISIVKVLPSRGRDCTLIVPLCI